MDFDLSNVKTNNMNNNYLDKKGVYILKVESYKFSGDIEGYNKTPFVRFNCVEESSGRITSFTLWMPKPTDPPARSEIKKKIIKEFFENLGCDANSLKGKALLESAIGKSSKVALREKERVIESKTTGRPMVVSDLDYYYSGTLDKPLKTNESKMLVPLNDSQRKDFEERLAAWKEANPQQGQGSSNNLNNFSNSFDNQPSQSFDPFGGTESNKSDDGDWPF